MLNVANAQDINVFDFDGVTPAFTGSDPVVSIANPTTDGINSSANVGELTHTGQYSDANLSVDIDPRIYTSVEMMVYSPYSTTGKVTIACFDANGNQLDWYESSAIATPGVWTKVTRNISFTKNIARVLVGFNRNDAPSATANDNIVYYDNLVFKKSTSSFITLYNETFTASWSQWGSWTGAPSTKAGSWFGGVNLETAGDAVVTLDRWWDVQEHTLKLSTTSADVIIPNINVAGFDSLKLSFQASVGGAAENPIVAVEVGAGNWVSVTTIPSGGNWSFSGGTQDVLLKDDGGNPISNVSAISLRLSHAAGGDIFYDNVKITGKVHSVYTSLSNKSKDVFSVYPNPATNYILTNNAQQVTITDLNGRLVKEAFNAEKVDVSSLAKGAYIVKVNVDGATKMGKLIKK